MYLMLYNNDSVDKWTQWISTAIKINSSLTMLCVNENDIHDHWSFAISNMLNDNLTVRRL